MGRPPLEKNSNSSLSRCRQKFEFTSTPPQKREIAASPRKYDAGSTKLFSRTAAIRSRLN